MKTPNKIIVIWRTIEGYEPQLFHLYRAHEIEEARRFAAYAMEKDFEDNTKAKYTITFYEKSIDK